MFLFKQTTANFRNINILFAPGLPGEMTQRPIFDDLSALGCDIYSFYYSGTYEQVGIFDLEQANKDLVNAIQEMEDKKLPFTILGYSFSTYFLQKIDLAQYPIFSDSLCFHQLWDSIRSLLRLIFLKN